MTTIAWDGETLAADRQQTMDGSKCYRATKIRRFPDGRLAGAAGMAAQCAAYLDWLDSKEGEPPEFQNSEHNNVHALEIMPDGRVFRHERYGRFEVEHRLVVTGSGGPFALAAMMLGRNAFEAVTLACELDEYSAGPVDVLLLNDPVRGRI